MRSRAPRPQGGNQTRVAEYLERHAGAEFTTREIGDAVFGTADRWPRKVENVEAYLRRLHAKGLVSRRRDGREWRWWIGPASRWRPCSRMGETCEAVPFRSTVVCRV